MSGPLPTAESTASRPNVVMILTDQLRWDHVGFGGNSVVNTPNLDRLAASGMVFDRAYVANPICMPNRATIFTGRMPSLHRVRANGIALDPRQRTFADVLREHGYSTGYIGKMHLQPMGQRGGDSADPVFSGDAWTTTDLPDGWNRYEAYGRHSREEVEMPSPFYGFEDSNLMIHHGDMVTGPYEHHLRRNGVNVAELRGRANALPCEPLTEHLWRTAVPEELYSTNYLTDQAIASLQTYAARPNPFLMVLSYPDPHHPFTPPGRFWEMYDPKEMELPATFDVEHRQPIAHHAEAWAVRGNQLGQGPVLFSPNADQFRECLAAQYGMIALIDEAVGRLLAELDRLGIADKTVIVFSSDHGDMMGDHGLLFKVGSHWDGCVRVPLVVHDPQRGAGRSTSMATSTDLAPTILDLCGVKPYAGLQGVSLAPVLDDPSATVRTSALIEEDQLFDMVGLPASLASAVTDITSRGGVVGAPFRMRSVITESGRLTWYSGLDVHELYRAADDPDEVNNLWTDPSGSAHQADMLEALVNALTAHADNGPAAREFA
jgi:arylsulfatase A-like enzyme